MKVQDLFKDLGDGLVLLQVFEKVAGRTAGKYSKMPEKTAQKINNLTVVLGAMKSENMLASHSSFSPSDIMKGNEKAILALMWQVVRGSAGGAGGPNKDARDEMLQWVNQHTSKQGVRVDDYVKSFQSGRAFAALMMGLSNSFPWYNVMPEDAGPAGVLHNADLAFEHALRVFGCPRLLRLEDMGALTEESVFTYLSVLRAASTCATSTAITHSVRMLPPECEASCTLVGRTLRGRWVRSVPLVPLLVEKTVVLLTDFEHKEFLPVEVLLDKISDSEVEFSFVADQIGTISIEVGIASISPHFLDV